MPCTLQLAYISAQRETDSVPGTPQRLVSESPKVNQQEHSPPTPTLVDKTREPLVATTLCAFEVGPATVFIKHLLWEPGSLLGPEGEWHTVRGLLSQERHTWFCRFRYLSRWWGGEDFISEGEFYCSDFVMANYYIWLKRYTILSCWPGYAMVSKYWATFIIIIYA